jgi:hypothetical protein
VSIKGTTTGTTTNAQGNFSLSVPDESTILVVSYVGYNPREITVGNQTVLTVALSPSDQLLSQVVVIGYGQQTKRDVTTAIASVKAADIKEQRQRH